MPPKDVCSLSRAVKVHIKSKLLLLFPPNIFVMIEILEWFYLTSLFNFDGSEDILLRLIKKKNLIKNRYILLIFWYDCCCTTRLIFIEKAFLQCGSSCDWQENCSSQTVFASITMVWFLYGVDPTMSGNITFRSKLFITHITLIKFFTRVYTRMIHKTIFVCILLIAIIILIWLLSSMDLLVSFKTTCLPKICVMRNIVYNSFIKSIDKNTKMKIEKRNWYEVSHLYNSFIKPLSQPVHSHGSSPVWAKSIYILPSMYSTK